MAKIPLPERGQPIDVSYVYQLANAINQLADQVTTTGFNYTTVDTPALGKQNIRTSEARIIAGTISVTSNSQEASGSTKTFTYAYNGNFKYTPVATATIVNTGGTATSAAAENATVIITNIDANGLTGLVRFNTAGRATTSVNLIIVGIPN
jgi:methionine synthase II (cobalamin-independent)